MSIQDLFNNLTEKIINHPVITIAIILILISFLLLYSLYVYVTSDGTVSKNQIKEADDLDAKRAVEIIFESNDWEFTPAYKSKGSNAALKGHHGELCVNGCTYPFVIINEYNVKSSTIQRSIGAARESMEREGYDSKLPYIFIFGDISSKNVNETCKNIVQNKNTKSKKADVEELFKPEDIKSEIENSNYEDGVLFENWKKKQFYNIGKIVKNYYRSL